MEKTLYFHACPYVVYIYICPYVHNLESARKILWTRLKKGNSCLGKPTIGTLDSSIMKNTAADLKAKGKKFGSTCDLLG